MGAILRFFWGKPSNKEVESGTLLLKSTQTGATIEGDRFVVTVSNRDLILTSAKDLALGIPPKDPPRPFFASWRCLALTRLIMLGGLVRSGSGTRPAKVHGYSKMAHPKTAWSSGKK